MGVAAGSPRPWPRVGEAAAAGTAQDEPSAAPHEKGAAAAGPEDPGSGGNEAAADTGGSERGSSTADPDTDTRPSASAATTAATSPRRSPFSLDALQAEVELLRSEHEWYVSRIGSLQSPSYICTKDDELHKVRPGEGPWDLTVSVRGGLRGGSEPEEASLEEQKDDSTQAESSRLSRTARAYDFPFQIRLRFDEDWPAQPPMVRFQCVMHHALIDDEQGMLVPFYKTLQRTEDKIFTIPLILEAVRRFLVDPLGAWGIKRSEAPTRLNHVIADNEEMSEKRLTTIKKYATIAKHQEFFCTPLVLREEWFEPTFWRAHQENTPEAWRGLLEEHLENEVYSFKMLSERFCELLLEEIFNFYDSGLPARRPNSMNNYGIILNEIGLEPLIDGLQAMLQPLGDMLWPGAGSDWDGHHCFIVRYREGEDLGLDMHTDDSDVTFNLCLGLEFKGAGLQFCGLMGAPNHRRHTLTYQHVKGSVVCHLGRKRHGADDISEGERLNLILWNHSSTYRETNEYREPPYSTEEGPPDQVCVSYTHDRDYGIFKEYPKGKERFKGRGWCPPKQHEYADFKQDAPVMLGGG